jgi:hypothetical protein
VQGVPGGSLTPNREGGRDGTGRDGERDRVREGKRERESESDRKREKERKSAR